MWRKIEEINNDNLLNKKAIKLYDKNDNLYSYHEVEKREVTNGENKGTTYYLFRYKDGKSVMNYTPNDYYELSGHLDISFDYPIIMTYEVDGYKDLKPVPVSRDYRLKQKSRAFEF